MQPDRDAVRVVPVGELDIATVDRLRAAVEELVAVGFERVVIDLRELVFIDCSGLWLLRALYDGARRDDWRLALIQGPAPVRRLFAVTETLALLPFVAPPPPR
ncbi:MAG: anti-sigma factor antagonist, partial [Solirubrobacteraceae bacterium]|nr:anti-sigma factor antagonist [Solirubrobacteraceae bacterium]